MPLQIGWPEIALRLGLAFLAAVCIGFKRGQRGEAAGLRTPLLVCLAAAVSMVQTNPLLATGGKASDSFAVLDMMRLPLGILTGMGFVGAGAILRRGNLVLGVTTAAALWFTTVMGLGFGGGQIGLGLISLALALFFLAVPEWLEGKTRCGLRATLAVAMGTDGLSQAALESLLREEKAEPVACPLCFRPGEAVRHYEFTVDWAPRPGTTAGPALVEKLSRNPSLRCLKWLPDGRAGAEAETMSPA